jgi:LacI family transcriptional regulator, galactose operon repressor
MRDVAALAGVSLKTVSRVVNQEPGVSEVLSDRVRSAAARLGYRHNLAASSLRRLDGKSGSIGLLLEDVSNPYSSAVHRAVEDVAREHGVLLVTASSDEDADRERAAIAALASRRVDGVIVMPASHDHSYLAAERDSGLGIVMLDRPPRFLDVDAVVTDNRAGATAGVRHLLAHGHRRIGYLGDLRTIETAAERLAGYRDAMREAGAEVDEAILVCGLRTPAVAADAAAAMLGSSAPPTALFCAQNLVTMGALRTLRALGVERRVALVGFDDLPLADLLEPGLTAVAQDPVQIGREAARQLFRRLDGDDSPSRTIVVPTRLVVRGSGEIAPLADAASVTP